MQMSQTTEGTLSDTLRRVFSSSWVGAGWSPTSVDEARVTLTSICFSSIDFPRLLAPSPMAKELRALDSRTC